MKRPSKKQLIIGGGAVLFISGLAIAYFMGAFSGNIESPLEPQEPSYSKLTGLEVTNEEANLPILGVMIENSEAARPQTGLNQAGIVFEATTEGGITRYLALYQEETPSTLGPVRSLRTHFLNWGMGFEAAIAHVGGSAEALDLAEQRDNARSLSQFKFDAPYYREDSRDAPHNMFARGAELRDLMEDQDFTASDFTEISRSDPAPSESPEINKITIDFSTPAFLARFEYDQEDNTYKRFLANQLHVDEATDQQIKVSNLLVLQTRVSGDSVTSIGNGSAVLFKDGKAIDIKWEKDDFSNRLRFINPEDNSEMPLNRGKTWISVVSDLRRVDY